jgi:hypothetical protein
LAKAFIAREFLGTLRAQTLKHVRDDRSQQSSRDGDDADEEVLHGERVCRQTAAPGDRLSTPVGNPRCGHRAHALGGGAYRSVMEYPADSRPRLPGSRQTVLVTYATGRLAGLIVPEPARRGVRVRGLI